jgi:biopolymer transport protein ExbD
MKIGKRNTEEIGIDMSPMIDMVFLLLIFFIVASQIIKVEKVKIEIPDAVYAKVPEDETGRFAITVNPKGTLYIGAEEVKMDELKTRLVTEVELDPKVRIVIRADGIVKYYISEKIMEACAEAGANDLIFAVFEG